MATKKQIEKQLNFEHALNEINHQWWNEQLFFTTSELEYLEELPYLNNKQSKRQEFLQNRLNYLQTKSNFENKNVRKFHKKVKKFLNTYGEDEIF